MRIGKCTFAIVLFIALAGVASYGQTNKAPTKPDLNGIWMLDHSRSNVGEIGKRDAPIKIVYKDPELRLTRTFERSGQALEREFTYYTDGRGETNKRTMELTTQPTRIKPEDMDRETIASKTTWQHDKLVTRAIIRNMVGGHVVEFEVIDEWKLSADGKTLTQTSRIVFRPDPMSKDVFVPARRPDDKRVYSLVSK